MDLKDEIRNIFTEKIQFYKRSAQDLEAMVLKYNQRNEVEAKMICIKKLHEMEYLESLYSHVYNYEKHKSQNKDQRKISLH